MLCVEGNGGGAGVASVVTSAAPTRRKVDEAAAEEQVGSGGGEPMVGCGTGRLTAADAAAASVHSPSRFHP